MILEESSLGWSVGLLGWVVCLNVVFQDPLRLFHGVLRLVAEHYFAVDVNFHSCVLQIGSSSHRFCVLLHGLSGAYHAARNQFERFRVFLELISRFEFEFRRRGNDFF